MSFPYSSNKVSKISESAQIVVDSVNNLITDIWQNSTEFNKVFATNDLVADPSDDNAAETYAEGVARLQSLINWVLSSTEEENVPNILKKLNLFDLSERIIERAHGGELSCQVTVWTYRDNEDCAPYWDRTVSGFAAKTKELLAYQVASFIDSIKLNAVNDGADPERLEEETVKFEISNVHQITNIDHGTLPEFPKTVMGETLKQAIAERKDAATKKADAELERRRAMWEELNKEFGA